MLVCDGDLREICDRETLNMCEQIIKRAARRKMDEAKRKKEDKKEREKERKLEKERVEKEMVFARDILHRMPKLGHENDVNEKEIDDIFSSSPHHHHQQIMSTPFKDCKVNYTGSDMESLLRLLQGAGSGSHPFAVTSQLICYVEASGSVTWLLKNPTVVQLSD